MYDKHYKHPRKYAQRDCSSLYPCVYLVFCCVGAPSKGKDRVSLKEMPHFFYTQHAANKTLYTCNPKTKRLDEESCPSYSHQLKEL